MRLEEGKNRVERSAPSSTGMRARAHTHAHTEQPPYTQLLFQSTFHLSSLVVFMFAELPVFPTLTPLFLAFKFWLQPMRTGKEGSMFIAGKQLGNSE